MAWTPRRRRWVLGVVLALTLAAVIWPDPREEAEIVGPRTAREPAEPRPAHDGDRVHLERLSQARGAPEEAVSDLFAAQSWYVPPPPPKPQRPAPPAPPPLPFQYLGRLVDNGVTTVFLTRQDRHYTVRPGDVIDNTYRVDAVEATQVVLTYLPLDMQQTLPIGGMQ